MDEGSELRGGGGGRGWGAGREGTVDTAIVDNGTEIYDGANSWRESGGPHRRGEIRNPP